jgi:streptogramin lyase
LDVRIWVAIGRLDPKSGDLLGYDIGAGLRPDIGRVDSKTGNRLLGYDIEAGLGTNRDHIRGSP